MPIPSEDAMIVKDWSTVTRDTEIIVISPQNGVIEKIRSAIGLGTKVYILNMKTPEARILLNKSLITYGIKEVI